MIQQKIQIDIEQEFAELRKSINNHLQGNFDINTQKKFLKNHIPSEIKVKAEILLDTLMNYLMETATKQVEKLEVEYQNEFFNQDFRNKIRAWLNQIDNQLKLIPPEVEFAIDPRWKQGAINGGAAFIIGTAATAFVYDPTKVVWAILTGLLTIIAAAYVFIKGFEKAEPKARSLIKSDIEEYINNAEKQVSDWLKTINKVFSEEFMKFRSTHSLDIGDAIE